MEGGGRKVSSLSYISDEIAVVMKPPSGDCQHDKEVKTHEKYLLQPGKQNKGEEDELKKGDVEEEDNIDIDGEHNKEDPDPGEDKEDQEETSEVMQKLDHEEYYQVEAIRKKRNHNGHLQYLIKWSNYPETDNTWEPYDNIKYCTDMLEDFEHSLQKHKSKSALSKMKRSIESELDCGEGAMSPGGGEMRIERDIQYIRRNPDRNVNSVYKKEKCKLKDENGKEKFITEDDEALFQKKEDDEAQAMTIDIPMQPLPKEGDTNFVMQDYVRKWREKEEAKAGIGAAAMAILAAHGEVPPVGPMGYLYSEFEFEPQSKKEGKRLTGAARRKTGRVTRFVHPDELANADTTEAITASVVATDTDTTIGNDSKMAPEELHITEISKPVHVQPFATSSPGTNNISHACITFKALRSDGTQVLVNNRELRASNPLLLIDFYEKHLRCTPDTI